MKTLASLMGQFTKSVAGMKGLHKLENNRRVVFYYSWSRPAETGAPLQVIENRFPALFESRRMQYPAHQELSDVTRFDQGIAGFLDQLMKKNFAAFAGQALAETGHPITEIERINDNGELLPLHPYLLGQADTLIVISFDSLRTGQNASAEEVQAVRDFLSDPDHLVFICPHHDIGDEPSISPDLRTERQTAAFLHHGDRTIPPQQGFGGFGRTLLTGLGVRVDNRFGLRPARNPDGSPAPAEIERSLDHLHLLDGVDALNLHPHLPHFERLGQAISKLDVLVRQKIDLTAPPHPFTQNGRTTFDAFLQSGPDVFAGSLIVCDATLWSSTAGGLDSLRQLWSNVLRRPIRSRSE